VKAFSFRLEQALRWRSAQSTLQEARVSAAGAVVARIQAQLDALQEQLRLSALQIRQTPTGEALNAHAEFNRHAERHIREFGKQLHDARRKLSAEMSLLIQARRRLQLIEDDKEVSRERWQKEFEKETADFADESHLGKQQAEKARLRRLQSHAKVLI
jgi:hypothetical protein